ncbi:hypothetical protein EDC04DRAFT_2866644 [Pisolithus marmoratus]|nr:hypothetical protein EDC04DRAFT_2866644 [Pisolithus marmoratus]
MRVEDGFQLTPFSEGNVFLNDPVLPELLERLLPPGVAAEVRPDLERLGAEVVTDIRDIAEKAVPPTLIQYNHWGQRIDRIQTSPAWKKLKEVFLKEGIPSIFYERKYGEFSRIYGFAKMHLLMGDTHMRAGGSDVSLTETTATQTENTGNKLWPEYELNGFKWFSSVTDSDVALTLARTGDPANGSRSLSLFLVPLRLPLVPSPSEPNTSLNGNGIYVHRLKNKIGTNMLPTAELSFVSTKAYLVGPLNQGVKTILPVLYVTRVHSAIHSIGELRKCLGIAVAYSKVRKVSGGRQLLMDNALHVAHLASITLVYFALTHLTYATVSLMGKVEAKTATANDERLLRILTVVAKAFTAEKGSGAMEEAMTALGGQGYMEEVGIGRSIRDGLVEKIWEGTIAVLALGLARSASLDPAAFVAFDSWAKAILDSCSPEFNLQHATALGILRTAVKRIREVYQEPGRLSPLVIRPALLLVGHTAASLALLEHAMWSWRRSTEDSTNVEVFRRWVVEGGLSASMEEVGHLMGQSQPRMQMNNAITYRTKL